MKYQYPTLAEYDAEECPQANYCKGDWAQDSRRILSNITDCGYGTTYL